MVLFRRLLGDVLRRHRQRQGRTLRDVAAAARISLGYLSEIERGRKEASSELLGSLCEALDVSLADVLREVSHDIAVLERQPLTPAGFVSTRVASTATRPHPVVATDPAGTDAASLARLAADPAGANPTGARDVDTKAPRSSTAMSWLTSRRTSAREMSMALHIDASSSLDASLRPRSISER